MCIRSPPLLSHRSACTAPTAREWLSANKSTTKQTNLTSSQPNMNSHHIAQQPRSRLASLRSNCHPARLSREGLACRQQNVCGSHLQSSSNRSEEHTSELQSLMRISYAVFCLKKKKNN